jgi:CheY-like chemotaxis protein
MRVLLIEDNPDHVFLARQAVEEVWRDATLLIARDLEEAQALYCSTPEHGERFDLLLAALDARDVHRLARLRELHDCPEFESTPIIALANSTRAQELAQVANQPLDWIILKPLRTETLREALRRRPLP